MGMGILGPGFDRFMRDELELGFRVACYLDDINAWGPEGATWWALHPGEIDDDDWPEWE